MTEYDLNEVVRQAGRMCAQYSCSNCPLNKYDDVICYAIIDDELAHAVTKVVEWAKANPELKYPSWDEWREQVFPNAGISLCMGSFVGRERAQCNSQISCKECRKQPIPADIAEKLGITPIGGSENVD